MTYARVRSISRFKPAVTRLLLLTTAMSGGAALYRAAFAQQPARPGPATRAAVARGSRELSPAQTAAVRRMNASLGALNQTLTTARAALVAASLASPRSDAAINQQVDDVRAAELALARARAAAFAPVQASPDALSTAQITALSATSIRGDRGHQGPGIPDLTSAQSAALTQLTGELMPLAKTLRAARLALNEAAFAEPTDAVAIARGVDAVRAADLALNTARASGIEKTQASADKLSPDQLSALATMGGVLTLGGFTEPAPLNFNDHAGYVSLFDGTTLKGWDGDPAVWRVEDGAIVGESTPQKPSGNTYLVYRDTVAKDFTLKFEIKEEGPGGSGMQYRSKTGVPWLAPVSPDARPLNLNWMMTGPQADFWPTQIYSGQFYSENTPMRIMAYRGQVIEGAGLGPKRLMANVGDRAALGKLVKQNDWNQYTVIARGGTMIHILNGQLMAVMVDDDPTSSNNEPGLIGIEIESITKISVRNVWLKKLN